MEALSTFWNFVLLNSLGDNPVTVGKIMMVAGLLIGAYFVVHTLHLVVTKRLQASGLQPDAVIIFNRVAFYCILFLIGFAVMGILGIPLAAFAFATGAIAIGVGFGAQNIINNFISGWILIAERPIRPDDFLEIEGAYGTVEVIGTRSTRIRRTDGVRILVPNSKLLENTVVNWTLIDKKVRTTLRVGVAYGSDTELVSDLLREVVTNHPGILAEPPAEFIFEDFGDSALIFDCYFWCDVSGEKSLRAIRSELRHAIAKIFEENDVVVAFPQTDVHFDAKNPIPVKIEKASD
jgi:small-conductance mechanosensitive channel